MRSRHPPRPRSAAAPRAARLVSGTRIGWFSTCAPTVALRAARRLVVVACIVAPGPVSAQRGFRGEGFNRAEILLDVNVPYDGAFEFARIRYASSLGMLGRGPLWSHDYARAEANFSRILAEVSTVPTRTRASAVFGLDDPLLFQHSVAYIVEVGYWVPEEPEVRALRTWLRRGGFLIVDDFQENDFVNFERQMKRVLPDAVLQPVPREHPVFDAFYRFTDFQAVRHPYSGYRTQYWGVFEGNDPTGRLMVIANYNGDIAEYWEFSDRGFFPVAESNEAYKLGVNYIVYGLTR